MSTTETNNLDLDLLDLDLIDLTLAMDEAMGKAKAKV